MVRTPDRRPRLVALLLVAALLTGLAATVSAAPALPACKVADALTKYRSYAHWHRSLLDHHVPAGELLRARRSAVDLVRRAERRVLGAPLRDRRPQVDGRPPLGLPAPGSSSSRRTAATRPSGRRSTTGCASTATPSRSRRAPGPATASTSSARPSTSAGTAARRPGTTRTGARPRRVRGSRPTPGSTASSCRTRRARRPSRATSTSRGTTAMSGGRGRRRSARADLTLREFLWREQNAAPPPRPRPHSSADAHAHTDADGHPHPDSDQRSRPTDTHGLPAVRDVARAPRTVTTALIPGEIAP